MKIITLHILIMILSVYIGCGIDVNQKSKIDVPYVDTGVNTNEWALIHAGKYYKGAHLHVTDITYDYQMMLTDVTNEQYAKYLNEALARKTIVVENNEVRGYYPGDQFDNYKHEFKIKEGIKLHVKLNEPGLRIKFDGKSFTVQNRFQNHPMVMVTWFGAKAYCDFYGWRLPTETEWEKAARGTDKRAYPWGDTIARNQANYYCSRDPYEALFGKQGGTTPVGFYNGKTYDGYATVKSVSPYGLYDMAGNVWQWTGDDYPYMHYRYMRGGSNGNYEYDLRVWSRNNAGPEYYSVNVGFRCARIVAGKK